MGKYTETRLIYAEDLRKLCISYEWYDMGTTAEYEHLLYELGESSGNLTTEDIVAIAEDIIEHTSGLEPEDIYSVCHMVNKAAHTCFSEA